VDKRRGAGVARGLDTTVRQGAHKAAALTREAALDGFPILKKDGLDADQRVLWDELTLGPRGILTGGADAKRLPDLYNAWMHFPAFGHLMLKVAGELRGVTELSGRLRELLVLTTSAQLGCRVEYDFHVPVARQQGLSDAVIAAIGDGATPPFLDEAERIVWEANVQLVRTATLTPALREEVVRILGHRGLMQLIAAVGLYVIVAYTSNVAGVRLLDDFSADETKLQEFFATKPADPD
jgi:4-carboxymuconolactone decarboxylase